jgi:hypothetical protein
MELITTLRTILRVIATISMIILTIIMVKRYLIDKQEITKRELLIYMILSFIYNLI